MDKETNEEFQLSTKQILNTSNIIGNLMGIGASGVVCSLTSENAVGIVAGGMCGAMAVKIAKSKYDKAKKLSPIEKKVIMQFYKLNIKTKE